MDSDGYSLFTGPQQGNNHSGQKIASYQGRRHTLTFALYGILFLLLLILLLIMGVKFAQLHQEVADIKFLLLSVNLSLMEPLSKYTEAEAQIRELFPHRQEHKAPQKGPCDEGWLFFEGSCYLLSSDRVEWQTAEKKCEEQKAHLLVINNANEQDFIAEVMHGPSYWIGLVERGEEGHWSWVDGTDYLATPHFWGRGQPDEWEVPENGEDCAEIFLNIFDEPRWNDASCSLRHHYVCELTGK
ncbi:hypothetical protein GJAV_G00031020 [Gymnothorax javanicus]|nr:hypothetical protein GJAV_G00031020 [Gymnothorax javanicus]